MLPGWLLALAAFTATCYVAAFFLGDAELTDKSETDGIQAVLDIITFQGISDVPEWLGWTLFVLCTVPWLLLLVGFMFQMFGSEIGAIAAIVLGAVVGLLAFLA